MSKAVTVSQARAGGARSKMNRTVGVILKATVWLKNSKNSKNSKDFRVIGCHSDWMGKVKYGQQRITGWVWAAVREQPPVNSPSVSAQHNTLLWRRVQVIISWGKTKTKEGWQRVDCQHWGRGGSHHRHPLWCLPSIKHLWSISSHLYIWAQTLLVLAPQKQQHGPKYAKYVSNVANGSRASRSFRSGYDMEGSACFKVRGATISSMVARRSQHKQINASWADWMIPIQTQQSHQALTASTVLLLSLSTQNFFPFHESNLTW